MQEKSKLWILFIGLLLFIATPLLAQNYSSEQEAKEIEGQLMSPCCWGGTVAEHNSQAAIDIKQGIRQMLDEGKTRPQILAFYEKKYGERILSAPKKSGFNLVAWILPFVIFIVGAILVFVVLRKMNPAKATIASAAKEQTDPEGVNSEDEEYRKKIDEELYGQSNK